MIIAGSAAPRPAQPKPHHDWWHEITSGELLTAGLKLNPQQLGEAVSASQSAGRSIQGAWKNLKMDVEKVFNLPVLDSKVNPAEQASITNILMDVASGVGYAAAGVEAAAGVYRLKKGTTTATRLEGLMDLAVAGAIATTIAGLGLASALLGPLAAVLGMARGSFNGVTGYRHGESSQEVQGLLDGTRSTGALCGLLGEYSGLLATAGDILGPVAGAIQMARGYLSLDSSLKTQDRAKELGGLSDMGTAVGLILTSTGVGLIPGVAVVVLSVAAKILYPLNKHFHSHADHAMNRLEPTLLKLTQGVDKTAEPILKVARKALAAVTGWHHGDEPPAPGPKGV